MKIRFLILSALISIGLLYVACRQPPEKAPVKAGRTMIEKKAAEQENGTGQAPVGRVLTVNSKTKTITVRSKDEDLELTFD